MKLLRWDGCFTVAMAHGESISHLYPERKRNILGSTNLAIVKNQYTSSCTVSFQGLPLFLGKEKSAKCTYYAPTLHISHSFDQKMKIL